MLSFARLFAFALASLCGGLLVGQDSEPASRVYAQASKSVFTIIVKSASGEAVAQATGFSVEGNRIITNEHVVRAGSPFLDLGTVRVALKIVNIDAKNDLAVLTPEGEISAPPLKFATAEPKPGSAIFALGNPAGLERSISTGVVAAIREFRGRNLLQISAPISPGSSGGPVLSANGEVVGVAVGTLEAGQNLNFAVPATTVRRLLSGQSNTTDLQSLLEQVDVLVEKRSQAEYSAEPDSPFQRIGVELDSVLSHAVEIVRTDQSKLLVVGQKAQEVGSSAAVNAFDQLVSLRPTAESYVRLARALKTQALGAKPDDPRLKKAESANRTAFKSTRQPTMEMYDILADILEDRGLTEESLAAFTKFHQLARSRNEAGSLNSALRGLVRTNSALQCFADVDRWFKSLVDNGGATPWDWKQQADRLNQRGLYKEAGDAYALVAQNQYFWKNWCWAANAYLLVSGAEDSVLETARACVKAGANQKDSDTYLAIGHEDIASVLNRRGVYSEALSHAREAVALNPNNAFAYNILAEAFSGLRRFLEAIDASKEAIRLSDGKYSLMHFVLASAYFETENWQAALQSFQKAAELEPKDDAAPYNVALCMSRLGYYRDAANWFEEVLRRNPNHKDRVDILRRIQTLRN